MSGYEELQQRQEYRKRMIDNLPRLAKQELRHSPSLVLPEFLGAEEFLTLLEANANEAFDGIPDWLIKKEFDMFAAFTRLYWLDEDALTGTTYERWRSLRDNNGRLLESVV